MEPWNNSLNFIFPTKYIIQKSLKFSHWPSKIQIERSVLHQRGLNHSNWWWWWWRRRRWWWWWSWSWWRWVYRSTLPLAQIRGIMLHRYVCMIFTKLQNTQKRKGKHSSTHHHDLIDRCQLVRTVTTQSRSQLDHDGSKILHIWEDGQYPYLNTKNTESPRRMHQKKKRGLNLH